MRARLAGLNRATRSIVLSAVLMLSVFAMPVARAAGFSIEIPIDTVVRGDVDTIHTVATRDVEPQFHGRECSVASQAINQHSVHPGNDLLVQSGGTQVVLLDIESDPNATVVGEGTLTLGEEIVVSVRLGEDEVFSGGLAVTVQCQELTTTTEATTSTTAAPTTTVATAPTTTIEDEVLGTVITQTTVAAEVLDTQVEAEELPFTGPETGWLLPAAVLLLFSGLMITGLTGNRRED